MKRLQSITRAPELALDTPIEVWLTLARDFLNVYIAFFTNKNPQNPVPLNPPEDEEPES